MDMGKSVNIEPQQNTAKQKPCAYFLGYTVCPIYFGNRISFLVLNIADTKSAYALF